MCIFKKGILLNLFLFFVLTLFICLLFIYKNESVYAHLGCEGIGHCSSTESIIYCTWKENEHDCYGENDEETDCNGLVCNHFQTQYHRTCSMWHAELTVEKQYVNFIIDGEGGEDCNHVAVCWYVAADVFLIHHCCVQDVWSGEDLDGYTFKMY